MKRGGPLRRGGPLERRTPLARGGGLVRRPRSTATAGGKHDTGPDREAAWMVDCRAAGGFDVTGGRPVWCEWPACDQRGVDRHHRLGRKSGGRHGPTADLINGVAWLLKACRPHHQLVTSASGDDLVLARAMGWLLVEGELAELVPVLTRHWPDPVWLHPDGTWSTTQRLP